MNSPCITIQATRPTSGPGTPLRGARALNVIFFHQFSVHESMKDKEEKKIEKNKKWRQRIYTSRRLLKNHIRRMERQLAVEIGSVKGGNVFTKMNYYPINSAMEWIITWKIKISNFPEIMWCDGIED